jgi:hypothetical protein
MNKSRHQLMNKLRWGVLITGITLGIVFISSPIWANPQNCIFPVLKQQLCKSINTELRSEYWKQASYAILQRPITGYGFSTFQVTSLRLRENISGYSSNVHNEYLELIYELGVYGLVISITYFFFLKSVVKKYYKNIPFIQMVSVVILSFSADFFFNYSLNYTIYMVIFSMMLAVYLRYTSKNAETISASKQPTYYKIYILCFIWICTPILWTSSRYILANIFYQKNPVRFVQVFPYIEWFAVEAIKSPETPVSTQTELLRIYKNHQKIYQAYLTRFPEDPATQVEILNHLLELDPLDYDSRMKLIRQSIKAKKSSEVLEQLHWLNKFPRNDRDNLAINFSELTQEVISYANELAGTDPEMAKFLTIQAYSLDTWQVNRIKTIFFLEPSRFERDDIDQIHESLGSEVLWSYGSSMIPWYSNEIRAAVLVGDYKRVKAYSSQILNIDIWKRWEVWKIVMSAFNEGPHTPHKKQALQEYLNQIKSDYPLGNEVLDWQSEVDLYEDRPS